MTKDVTDLGLPSIDVVDQLPAAALPAFVLALTALQARAAARLVMLPAHPAPTATSRYVTQTEAAAMFGIPLATVRSLTRRGVIPAIGKGKSRRLLPADLERHLARCARDGLAIRGIPEVSRRRDRGRGASRAEGARDDASAIR